MSPLTAGERLLTLCSPSSRKRLDRHSAMPAQQEIRYGLAP